MCHNSQLSPAELNRGLLFLSQFLDSNGAENHKQSHSHWDIACYFPAKKSQCRHCGDERIIPALESVIRQSMENTFSDAEKEELLKKIYSLASIGRKEIYWLVFFIGLELDWDLSRLVVDEVWDSSGQVEKYPNNYLFYCLIPRSVSRAVGYSTLNATRIALEQTQKVISKDAKQALVRSRNNIEHLVSGEINSILSPEGGLRAAELVLITERVLEEGTEQQIKHWYQRLIDEDALWPVDLRALVDSVTKSGIPLSLEMATLVSELLDYLDYPPYPFSSSLDHIFKCRDEQFLNKLIQVITSENSEITASTADLVTKRLVTYHPKTKQLSEFLSSSILLSSTDFSTLNYLQTCSDRFYQDVVEQVREIERFAVEQPENSNLLVVCQAAIDMAGSLRGEEREVLHRYIIQEFQGYKGFTQLRGIQLQGIMQLMVGLLIRLPELYSAAHIYFQNVLGQGFHSTKKLAALLQTHQNAEVLWQLISNSHDNEKTNLVAVAVYSLAEDLEEQTAPETLFELTRFALENSLFLPQRLLEVVLTRICQVDSREIAERRIGQLLSFEEFQVPRVLNELTSRILRSDSAINHGLIVINEMQSLDMRIHPETMFHASVFAEKHGFTFGTEFDDGEAENNWNQLALIFDDVRHELNQPLVSMAMYIDGLKADLESGSVSIARTEQALNGLSSALTSIGNRMDHYTAISSGEILPAIVDIKALLVELIGEYSGKPELESVEIQLRTNKIVEPKWVRVPVFQFKLALRNLINNAIQAVLKQEGERLVVVELRSAPHNSDRLVLRVRDTGPGIPAEVQDNIFTRGFTTKAGHGLGLGLALTANVIRDLGGVVKLESTGESGSIFSISLDATSSPRKDIRNLNQMVNLNTSFDELENEYEEEEPEYDK